MRAAIYTRVSTIDQTTENQRRELLEVAARRGWTVVQEYTDHGISGSKKREDRPGLQAMMKAASQHRFDVVMSWAVDRLGRSLADLVRTLEDLNGAKVDLYLHQQAMDTTTPSGKAMFQMCAVFAEFELAMNRERIHAGLARAVSQGKKLGPRFLEGTNPKLYAQVRELLEQGASKNSVRRNTGCGMSLIVRVARQIELEKKPAEATAVETSQELEIL